MLNTNINEFYKKICDKNAVLRSQRDSLSSSLSEKTNKVMQIKSQSEVLLLSSTVLQEVVSRISEKNIKKIEELVTFSLKSIFTDLDLEFQVRSKVKRNLTTYYFVFLEGGKERSINSLGGGVVAITSLVLKVLFNVLTSRFPIVVFDESLSFVADKYIPNSASFLKDISDQFNLAILMVTHQPLFFSNCDVTLMVDKVGGESILRKELV